MSNQINDSLSLARPDALSITNKQKVALAIGLIGLLILALALLNTNFPNKALFLTVALGSIFMGTVFYAREAYLNKSQGIKNDGVWFKSVSSRGVWGWSVGVVLTAFYIVLYFYAELLGLGSNGAENTGLVSLFDPLSQLLSGRNASQWFVYGTLYTLAILAFGVKFIYKYRHNRYQQLRTVSVMFFQLAFAFLIPEFMYVMNNGLPYYDLKSVWPLNYYLFDEWSVKGFLSSGQIGFAFLIFGVLSIFVITPILTYKYGKRWYCSWVCGCGGLAETIGDPFRQLSSKKMSSWRLERWLIHTVLVFSVVMTTAMVYTYLGYDANSFWLTRGLFIWLVIGFLSVIFTLFMVFKAKEFGKDVRYGAIGFAATIVLLLAMHFTGNSQQLFFLDAGTLRSAYGFYIGSIFLE